MALQERYANLAMAKLRATSVLTNLFNHKYEGDPKCGAVKVPVRSEATVGDYVIATGGAINHTQTTYATLNIDKDKFVNEVVDGYEADAVPDNIVAERLDSCGYALANTEDITLSALLKTKGTKFTPTKTGVYGEITEAISKLKKKHIKVQNMWLLVSVDYELEIINDANFIKASAMGDSVMMNGQIGKIGGVPVILCDNMPASTSFILGNNIFCSCVDEWKVAPHVVGLANEFIGASAVQGRFVFGADVLDATTVLYK